MPVDINEAREFARQLERELTATRARLAELEEIADKLGDRIGCGCGGDYAFCNECTSVLDGYEQWTQNK